MKFGSVSFFGLVWFFGLRLMSADLTMNLMFFGRENYYQEGNVVYPRLKVLEAYKRALTTWAKWVDKNIDRNQTHVVFRGYSETHFR